MGSIMISCDNGANSVSGFEKYFAGAVDPSRSQPAPREKLSHILRLIVQCVAIAFETSAENVTQRRRGCANTARARQAVAYLMHTGLSVSLSDISRLLDRDRTTIGHSCRMIEDLRDCPDFDRRLRSLEEAVSSIRELLDA